jgi:hypothetical protein
MPLTLQLNKDYQLDVGGKKKHIYNSSCHCMRCSEIWIGLSTGDLVIMDPSGQHRMVHASMATDDDRKLDRQVKATQALMSNSPMPA